MGRAHQLRHVPPRRQGLRQRGGGRIHQGAPVRRRVSRVPVRLLNATSWGHNWTQLASSVNWVTSASYWLNDSSWRTLANISETGHPRFFKGLGVPLIIYKPVLILN